MRVYIYFGKGLHFHEVCKEIPQHLELTPLNQNKLFKDELEWRGDFYKDICTKIERGVKPKEREIFEVIKSALARYPRFFINNFPKNPSYLIELTKTRLKPSAVFILRPPTPEDQKTDSIQKVDLHHTFKEFEEICRRENIPIFYNINEVSLGHLLQIES